MNRAAALVGRERELERFAAALVEEGRCGLVLRGPAGTGKTRLAHECLALAEDRGHVGRRVLATASARSVPLGAMASLVPPLGSEVNPLGAALAALRTGTDGAPLLLLVDDAQWLDDTSAALVHQVVAEGGAFGLLTVREGEEAPAAIVSLLHHAGVIHVDVGPLDDAEVAAMASEVLGGDVDPALARRVVDLSAGSPLTAHELLVGAVESGAVAQVDGCWTEVAHLERTPRVTDLVAQRVGRLEESARRSLGLVALAEPLPLAWVPSGAVPDLARLEDAGLVTVRGGDDREELWVAHPLYGEVLRGGLSGLQRRALLADLVAAARRRAPEDRDHLRLVLWSLDLGLPVGADDLRGAARRAFATHRFDLASRFLEAVPELDRDSDHRFALMSARFYCDDLAGGLGLLAGMEAEPVDERELARAIEHRILHAQVAGDFAAASAIAEAGLPRLGDPAERARVEQAALSTTILEMPSRQAVEVLLPLIDQLDDRMHVAAGIALTIALSICGRTRQAREMAGRSHEVHRRLWVEHGEELPPSQPTNSLLFECLALCFLGHPQEGEALLAGASSRVDAASGMLADADTALAHAVVAYRAGRLRDAADRARAAVAEYSATVHDRGPRWVMAAGFAVLAAAQMGEPEEVAEAVALLDQGRPAPITDGFVELSRAWGEVVLLGPSVAADRLAAMVERATAAGELLWAAEGAWSMARLGAADRVPDAFEAGAGGLEGDLVEAIAEAVAATRRGDAAALEAIGGRLGASGCVLDGAEAFATAAHTWIGQGQPRRAVAAARRARALAACGQGIRTPALVLPTEPVALTAREREVATLAAAGTSARAIAARLGISERTVTNHLQRAYEKLGVSSRAELRGALAVPAPE